MIPRRLEIANFLSYQQGTVLDFEGIDLACIAGPNGAGKSSILDAITWALFGRSRGKSDDDVVNRRAARNGEAAEITFDFDLGHSPYRVIRRKQTGKTTVLEFQMGDGHGAWKSLSEGRVRDTEAAIEQLLQLNYDTFINASFLLQGRADEFTTKSPGKRKEILAELLGVTRWDRYREEAAVRRKGATAAVAALDAQLGEIEAELATEPEREAALAAAEAELKGLSGQLQLKEELLRQARKLEETIKNQRLMLQNLAENRDRAQKAVESSLRARTERERELQAYQELLDRAEAIEAEQAVFMAAEAGLQSLQAKANAHNSLQQRRQPHLEAIARAAGELEQRVVALEKQKAAAAAAESERALQQDNRDKAESRQRELDEALSALAEKEQRFRTARTELSVLESERAGREQELKQLQRDAGRAQQAESDQQQLARQMEQASRELEQLSGELAQATEASSQVTAGRSQMETLAGELPALKERMEELKQRLESLDEETGGICPLCGQTLSESHREQARADLEAKGRKLGDQYRSNQGRIEALALELRQLETTAKSVQRLEQAQRQRQEELTRAETRAQEATRFLAEWSQNGAPRLAELAALQADNDAWKQRRKEVANLENELSVRSELDKERQAVGDKKSRAEARLAEIDRLAAEWAEQGDAELETVSAQLSHGTYALPARQALADIDQEVAELGYDLDEHEAVRQQREALSQAPSRHQELIKAQAAAVPLAASLAQLGEQVAEQQKTLGDLQRQYDTAAGELAALEADGGDLTTIEDGVIDLREQEKQAQQRMGAAATRLEVLQQQRQRRRQLQRDKDAQSLLGQRLSLLEKAFGRNGVQALLIEHALPEVEGHANELLERLSGGEMRVYFETQRQLKSKDAQAETLDIHIGDSTGQRPYESYSGGEQFRINFAIRLALSRMLARKAGARLETLVIDEGFGSQDPEGRQKLVEAINLIRADFARILVITHIGSLRDVFPWRIEVSKTDSGSQIEVV